MSSTSQLTDFSDGKTCSKCRVVKPFANFSKRNAGLNAWCKPCHRSYMEVYGKTHQRKKPTPEKLRQKSYREKHGITVEQYDVMFAAQHGRCAICGTTTPGKNVRNFTVDHCHQTSRIRGLLCRSCNMALGLLHDSVPAILKAADYLQRTAP